MPDRLSVNFKGLNEDGRKYRRVDFAQSHFGMQLNAVQRNLTPMLVLVPALPVCAVAVAVAISAVNVAAFFCFPFHRCRAVVPPGHYLRHLTNDFLRCLEQTFKVCSKIS